MKFDLSFEQTFKTFAYIEYQNLHKNIYTLDLLYTNMQSYIDNFMMLDLQKEIDKELSKIENKSIGKEEAGIIIQSIWGSSIVSFESLNIYSQHMIVAMYSFFEKSLKETVKIFREHKLREKGKISTKRNFNIENFIEYFGNFGINIKKIKSYDKIEHIRKLSNLIKHESNELNNLHKFFIKYKNEPVDFIHDLNIMLDCYEN